LPYGLLRCLHIWRIIHPLLDESKLVKPDRATIIVQIMLRGEAPQDSTARVDIGSYSADPTGNIVSYGEQSQTVPLKEKNIVVKFTAEVKFPNLTREDHRGGNHPQNHQGSKHQTTRVLQRLARRIGNDGSLSLLAVGPVGVILDEETQVLRRSLHS
jgi:hypothetical protein